MLPSTLEATASQFTAMEGMTGRLALLRTLATGILVAFARSERVARSNWCAGDCNIPSVRNTPQAIEFLNEPCLGDCAWSLWVLKTGRGLPGCPSELSTQEHIFCDKNHLQSLQGRWNGGSWSKAAKTSATACSGGLHPTIPSCSGVVDVTLQRPCSAHQPNPREAPKGKEEVSDKSRNRGYCSTLSKCRHMNDL